MPVSTARRSAAPAENRENREVRTVARRGWRSTDPWTRVAKTRREATQSASGRSRRESRR
ncbi:hypothetical protein GCM10023336_42290 [Streptomyces similanensis]|uniref:Uncharacterized protein n=1 Tax=Streptomyces similanensis TaxID=1274988 RepID=A0ABP9KPZ4_9ACTN